ncbi:MAG: VPLPA-CTERM sorting domain-containing protein [Gammaproteobacteria bacterium]|jgi:hypothetical protein|nr:VPLPA-CTERM sorting domain-containing protein [Gammaproteobacteria bacterium]
MAIKSIALAAITLVVSLGLVTLPVTVNASTLTFEDGSNAAAIPDGYAGFDWMNCRTGGTGTCFNFLTNGTFPAHTGSYFAYLNSGDLNGDNIADTGIIRSSNGGLFNFESGYFSANWRSNMTLTVEGFLSGASQGSQTLTLGYRSMSLQTLNFNGIDEIHFAPSGGTAQGSPFYPWQSYAFSMDDVVISAVPIPAAAWLFGSGLLGLIGVSRRQVRI